MTHQPRWATIELSVQSPFAEELTEVLGRDYRRYEAALECVARIRTDPDNVGLQLKDVGRIGGRQVLSGRVDDADRIILVELDETAYGVLHLFTHDSYMRWLEKTKRLSARDLESAGDVSRDGRIYLPNRVSDMAVEPASDPLAEIQAKLAGGMRSFLAALSPDQRRFVDYDASTRKGVTLVKGGAGTGKTAIAIGRVAYLARQPEFGRRGVLYLCYNRVLVNVLRDVLDQEFGGRYPHGFIHAQTLHEWAWDFLLSRGSRVSVADSRAAQEEAIKTITELLRDGGASLNPDLDGLTPDFVRQEIVEVIRPNGFTALNQYLDVERLRGRRTLKRRQRAAIWEIDQALGRKEGREIEWQEVPAMALKEMERTKSFVPYKAAVLDEGQDFGPVMIRLARALVGGDDRRLLILADPSQSIYPSGFHWAQKELSVKGGDVRWLRKPYRNTAQVQELATALAEPDEGAPESDRPGREGPRPRLLVTVDRGSMVKELVTDLNRLFDSEEGWRPDNIAILASTWQALEDAAAALKAAGLPFRPPVRDDKKVELADGRIKLLTIHAAKGLDFPIVYFFDATKTGFRRMEANERFLFYVALTRSAFKLTVLTVADDAHMLLTELDSDAYEIGGSAANLWPPVNF